MSDTTPTTPGRRQALIGLAIYWSLFITMFIFSFKDIRSTWIQQFGSEQQRSSLKLEIAQQDLAILLHSFDKAVRKNSSSEFIVALSSFHRLNRTLLELSAKSGLIEDSVFENELKLVVQKTVKHFIAPFNKNIKTLNANPNNQLQRRAIINFIADYQDFELLFQGPLHLGRIVPLKPQVLGI